jgi:DNA-binding response OmpR family regulator
MSAPLLLLVDDSPEMGLIVRSLGKRGGAEVVHRTGVAAAWDFLRERTPDMLLLDMRLTGESGADLCRRVRDASELNGLRVALFTNWVLHDDICAGLEAGADLVFAKDLVSQLGEWQRRLREILGWTRGRVFTKLEARWGTDPCPDPPADWVAVYNQALQQTLARRFSASLQRTLLRRAVLQALAHTGRAGDPDAWLDFDRGGLCAGGTVGGAETAAALGASLAEQLWCVLGSPDSAFFADALAAVLPALREALQD